MAHPQDAGRCLLDGYFECAAKIPEACICIKMPRNMVIELSKKKYGELPTPQDGLCPELTRDTRRVAESLLK